MVSSVTTTTVAAVTSTAVVGTLGAIAIVALIAFLAVKELAAAGDRLALTRLARVLDVAIVPLMAVFLITLGVKVATIVAS